MDKLASCEDEFAEMVSRCDEIESQIAECENASEIYALKSEVAQMVGQLDKLQSAGVDAVSTGGLKSGKEEARSRRKSLSEQYVEAPVAPSSAMDDKSSVMTGTSLSATESRACTRRLWKPAPPRPRTAASSTRAGS